MGEKQFQDLVWPRTDSKESFVNLCSFLINLLNQNYRFRLGGKNTLSLPPSEVFS